MTEFSTPLAATPQPAALMALYDINYQCLLALCPSLRNPAIQPHPYLDDSLPGRPPLRLVFYEHTRHTATLGLACRRDGEGAEFLPDVQLRLYRDSRQVELLARDGVSLFPNPIPEGSLQEEWLSRRYSGNRFLFDWLRDCLRRGYHLAADSGRLT